MDSPVTGANSSQGSCPKVQVGMDLSTPSSPSAWRCASCPQPPVPADRSQDGTFPSGCPGIGMLLSHQKIMPQSPFLGVLGPLELQDLWLSLHSLTKSRAGCDALCLTVVPGARRGRAGAVQPLCSWPFLLPGHFSYSYFATCILSQKVQEANCNVQKKDGMM